MLSRLLSKKESAGKHYKKKKLSQIEKQYTTLCLKWQVLTIASEQFVLVKSSGGTLSSGLQLLWTVRRSIRAQARGCGLFRAAEFQ
jgi:hypothetical protein